MKDGGVEFEPYRGELVAYCYRMLGSVHEAEDLVQETMLRAWKARDRYDSARASVRTWLYRIATNACLSAVDGRARRPLPSGLGAASDDPAAVLTPAVDIAWLQPFPDARFDVALRADMRLALVAAMQVLPRGNERYWCYARCWSSLLPRSPISWIRRSLPSTVHCNARGRHW
jgi:RNA polymerase sigma-70 factor, ECF subfamily